MKIVDFFSVLENLWIEAMSSQPSCQSCESSAFIPFPIPFQSRETKTVGDSWILPRSLTKTAPLLLPWSVLCQIKWNVVKDCIRQTDQELLPTQDPFWSDLIVRLPLQTHFHSIQITADSAAPRKKFGTFQVIPLTFSFVFSLYHFHM